MCPYGQQSTKNKGNAMFKVHRLTSTALPWQIVSQKIILPEVDWPAVTAYVRSPYRTTVSWSGKRPLVSWSVTGKTRRRTRPERTVHKQIKTGDSGRTWQTIDGDNDTGCNGCETPWTKRRFANSSQKPSVDVEVGRFSSSSAVGCRKNKNLISKITTKNV